LKTNRYDDSQPSRGAEGGGSGSVQQIGVGRGDEFCSTSPALMKTMIT